MPDTAEVFAVGYSSYAQTESLPLAIYATLEEAKAFFSEVTAEWIDDGDGSWTGRTSDYGRASGHDPVIARYRIGVGRFD